MSEQNTGEPQMAVGTSLAAPVHESLSLARAPQMTDAEMQSSFRMAQALSASGLFKDVASAEKAFAKLVIGRDLGLSPAQSLSLYAMEGKIEVPYPMLAMFLRAHGYRHRIEWRVTTTGLAVGRESAPVESKWVSAKDPEANDGVGDVTGARITISDEAEVVGVSTWTVEDSERAGLTANRGSKASNHKLYPRNLFLARALSNGCRWYVPEVLGGLPVYAEGEIDSREELGAGTGEGGSVGWGRMSVELAGQVERTIRRAEKLGHAGLANRESVQLQLHGRSEGDVREWLRESNEELNALKVDVPLVEVSRPDPADAKASGAPALSYVEAAKIAMEPEPVEATAVEEPAPLPIDAHAALVAARAAAAAAQTEEAFDAAMREVERLSALAGDDPTPEA